MQRTIKYKGQKVSINGPLCFDEMDTECYQRLINEWTDKDDFVKAVSIMYNMDYDMLMDMTDQSIVGPLCAAARFLVLEDPKLEEIKMPKYFEYNGQKWEIPVKLGNRSFGQAVMLRRRLEKSKYRESLLSIAVAIYMQPIITGERFSMEAAVKFEQEILKMPIKQIAPIGFFFLSKSSSNGNVLSNFLNLWKLLGIRNVRKLLDLQGLTCLSHLQI